MKKTVFSLLAILFTSFGLKAATYTYTVNVPANTSCDFEVCAWVDYSIQNCRSCFPQYYSTAPICATINRGSSHTFTITTPNYANFLDVHFSISSGSFSEIAGTSEETFYGGCSSADVTQWLPQGNNLFILASSIILGGN